MSTNVQQTPLLIRGGKIVNDDRMFDGDVLVEDGLIKQIGEKLLAPSGARVIDAKGKYVIPGGIDTHTHLQASFMGAQCADDFYSGTKAALAGGTTMIIDFAMDNTGKMSPLEEYEEWRRRADGRVCCDYALHVVVNKWTERTSQEIALLTKEKGINSFKMFMAYKNVLMLHDDDLIKAFEACRENGALAQVHAENGDIILRNEKMILEMGITGPEGHLFSRPEEVETEATHRAIVLADQVNCPLFVVHVMSKTAADIIAHKRKEGCVVFGEPIAAGLGTDGTHYMNTCWRHAACHVLSPPLRPDPTTPGHLMDKLGSGDLECVGTDHIPFHSEKKAMGANDFTKIPNGINGIQERMMVVWEKGVVTGKLDPCKYVAVTSANAAKVFNIYPRKGRIQAGSDADIVVLDPQKRVRISAKTHVSNTDFNIFEGMECKGAPLYVISGGRVVMENDKVNVEPGMGRFIATPPFCDYVYKRMTARAEATRPKKVERQAS